MWRSARASRTFILPHNRVVIEISTASFRTTRGYTFAAVLCDEIAFWRQDEMPPCPGVQYHAFCDPSGGVSDSMTLAVAHLQDGSICVLDAVLECRPPFDPEVAVADCTAVRKRFGVTRVVGDRYAGEWPRARFAEHGISFEQSAKPKSDIYHDLLPLLNAKRVELLDHPRLSAQLVGLERRTARSGRDSIDHSPGGHDDLANSVAGVLVSLDLDRRPALVKQADVLERGVALPLPTYCKSVWRR